MHLSLALQPTDISILVGFTTALIGGYPKRSKHITRTLQTYRLIDDFPTFFLPKAMVIFRFILTAAGDHLCHFAHRSRAWGPGFFWLSEF